MFHKMVNTILGEFFLLIILAAVGGAVLMSPQMHTTAVAVSFLDSLFTATSALSVTGLTVLPTGSTFTQLGKLVILLLIEIGGIGIVVLGSFFEIALLKRTPDGINYSTAQELVAGWHKIPKILFFSIGFIITSQIIGFFTLWQLGKFDPFDALFHAVSAFNNAGFSTFDTNLLQFKTEPRVLVPIEILIFLGSVGFLTVAGIYNKVSGRIGRISRYTSLTLKITFFLYVVAASVLFLDLILHGATPHEAFWEATFQSIALRTAGFNTIEMSQLGILGILISILMMIIGGGSISTAGGMKTSTIYVLFKNLITHLNKNETTLAFKKTAYIPKILVETAYFILVIYVSVFIVSLFLLSLVEDQTQLTLTDLAFESVSALSTVGLSTGVTTQLNEWGKLIIIFDMLVGRLGIYVFVKQFFINTPEDDVKEQDNEKLDELELAVG